MKFQISLNIELICNNMSKISHKELRIGNLVLFISEDDTNEYYDISGINEHYISFSNYMKTVGFDEVKPIPITKEWLLKLGGEIDCNGDVFIYENKCNDIRYYLLSGFIQRTKGCYTTLSNFSKVKYVHQLQNLYYAITNYELTIS